MDSLNLISGNYFSVTTRVYARVFIHPVSYRMSPDTVYEMYKQLKIRLNDNNFRIKNMYREIMISVMFRS